MGRGFNDLPKVTWGEQEAGLALHPGIWPPAIRTTAWRCKDHVISCYKVLRRVPNAHDKGALSAGFHFYYYTIIIISYYIRTNWACTVSIPRPPVSQALQPDQRWFHFTPKTTSPQFELYRSWFLCCVDCPASLAEPADAVPPCRDQLSLVAAVEQRRPWEEEFSRTNTRGLKFYPNFAKALISKQTNKQMKNIDHFTSSNTIPLIIFPSTLPPSHPLQSTHVCIQSPVLFHFHQWHHHRSNFFPLRACN